MLNFSEKHDMQELKTTGASSPDNHNDNLNTQRENKSLKGCYRSTEVQTTSSYMHPLIGPISVTYSNVASHMHAACDILPCSHGNRDKNKTLHGEIACHKQEGMLRNPSCECPVEIAIPVVGLQSNAGSLECMEEKSTEVTVGDLGTDNDSEFNYDAQRDSEERRSVTEPRHDKRNTVSAQKNEARQKEGEKRVDMEFQKGSTGDEEEPKSGLDNTVREHSIRKGDTKTSLAEAIDEVSVT